MTQGAALAIVITTVGTREAARVLAHALVEARLADCVQVSEIASTYRWGEGIEEAGEWLLACKVRHEDLAIVEAAIAERHPYDVPEIIALPVDHAARSYAAWLLAATER